MKGISCYLFIGGIIFIPFKLNNHLIANGVILYDLSTILGRKDFGKT